MKKYNEVKGDIISLALEGKFDVVVHGCNCFCVMGAGLAPQMVQAFNVDKFPMEGKEHMGDINKLGTIDYQPQLLVNKVAYPYSAKRLILNQGLPYSQLIVVNAYTQYDTRSKENLSPVDYEAITLCMRKMNVEFQNLHIGLPFIGAGLAGGDWNKINTIIKQELKDCDVTIVEYQK